MNKKIKDFDGETYEWDSKAFPHFLELSEVRNLEDARRTKIIGATDVPNVNSPYKKF